MQCVMDHMVLNMTDEMAMIVFYSKTLQLQTERLEEYRAGEVPFPSVRLNDNTIIDLFPKAMWQHEASAGPGRENLNHFCLALDKSGWSELRERLKVNTVAITMGPVLRWGAHGSGTSIYFSDPEGNTIEARYYEDDARETKCLLGS
jgi:catechol-2,3-dioxygenase